MDQESLDLLSHVHPKLSEAIKQLDEKIPIKVATAYRSSERQAEIFAQGRTAPGDIVTNAPPGHSWHEFGLAVDVCPVELIDQPHWAPDSPLWIQLADAGHALGLFPGALFSHPDRPHFQLTGDLPLSPDQNARNLLENGGVEAVWQATGL